MSDRVQVDLIVKAIAEGFGNLMKDFGGLEAANAAAGRAANVLTDSVLKSIDANTKWAGTIDELARVTGQSYEETSKLAVVMGDIGISTDTLKVASKSLKDQGLVPTLDTIKKLAAEYQAIESPVERNKWGIKTLGKAYFDLGEALTKTPEELDALGDAAERTGKIMSEEAVAAAEKYEESLAQLKDTSEGVAIQFGGKMVEGANAWIGILTAIAKADNLNTIATLENTGAITAQQAELRRAAVYAGEAGAAYKEVTPPLDGMTDAHERAAASTEVLRAGTAEFQAALESATASWMSYVPEADAAYLANKKLQETLEPLTGAASDLAFGMGELTTATLFHQAAQGLDADASLALAQSMGLIDAGAAAAKSVLDELRAQLESGAITTEEYTTQVSFLNQAILGLPDGKVITIEMLQEYTQQFNAEMSGQGGTETGQHGGAVGDGTDADWATGVQGYVVPPGYPNDSFRMGVQSGEVVDVWKSPAERARAMGGGGDNVTNNFYDHRATAMYLADQRRKKRARADALMGA